MSAKYASPPRLELLEDRACPSSLYDYEVIATSGVSGLAEIAPGVSINDNGYVAFVGRTSSGEGLRENVYAVAPQGGQPYALMDATYALPNVGPPAHTFAPEVQLNNANQVLARRQLDAKVRVGFTESVQPLTYLEKWDATQAGGLPVGQVASGDGGLGRVADLGFPILGLPIYQPIDPPTAALLPSAFARDSDFAGLFNFSSMNNNGQAAYGALLANKNGGGNSLISSPHSNITFLGIGTSGFAVRPMIADDGTIVARNGDETQSIFALDFNLGNSRAIAEVGQGKFSRVGLPAISDDGRAIAFVAEDSQGPGVFLAARTDEGFRPPERLVGVSGNGILDPLEDWSDDDGDGLVGTGEDRGLYSGFSRLRRVGIAHTPGALDPNGYTVVFLAENLSGQTSLHRVEVSAPPVGPFFVSAPFALASVGGTLDGLPGTIADLDVHDPLSARGEVAFWVRTEQTQAVVKATLPGDTDADGLLDVWETNGIDANGDGRVDLRLPNADPHRKDVYVEIDAMTGLVESEISLDGDVSIPALDGVVEAFANSPVKNATSSDGVSLHLQIDRTDAPRQAWGQTVRLPNGRQALPLDFFRFKEENFGTASDRNSDNAENILAARRLAYRYAVFAHSYLNADGQNDSTGIAEFGGNDFAVTLGNVIDRTADDQAGTFMHELGHTLGLDHGGGDVIGDKPNYYSVMNYVWQRRYRRDDDNPLTPLELAYRDSWRPDYSSGTWNRLDESGIDEARGLGGPEGIFVRVGRAGELVILPASGPVDLDGDGVIGTGPADVNTYPGNTVVPNQILTDFNDWAALQYDFRKSFRSANGEPTGTTSNELTEEAFQLYASLTTGSPPATSPPLAADDAFAVPAGLPAALAVLTNDADPDGDLDATSVFISSPPAGGTAVVDPLTGVVTYTPAAGFSGNDSFRYTVADLEGSVSNEATVSVAVIPPTPPPPPSSAFRVQGNTLFVTGTTGDDHFLFVAGTTEHRVTLNGETFFADASSIAVVQVDGNGGHDRAELHGGSQAETLLLAPGGGALYSATYYLGFAGFADVEGRGGPDDYAIFDDSAGGDTFLGTPTVCYLYGSGFVNQARGFGSVDARSTHGGHDYAVLRDSLGDDTYTALPGYATMQGVGFGYAASGFASVDATSANGRDVAYLHGSSGDDSSSAFADYAAVSAAGFGYSASDFAEVTALLGEGEDVAYFFSPAGESPTSFVANAFEASLNGDGFVVAAVAAERIFAFGSTGPDSATIYDTAGDDSISVAGTAATFRSDTTSVEIDGYDDVSALSIFGGLDVVFIAPPVAFEFEQAGFFAA